MQAYLYLMALLFSVAGVTFLDWRYRLAWWWQPRRVALAVGIGMLFFLVWDIAGIVLQVFWANQEYVSGWYVVTPDLPIEEFIFLFFLNYLTAVAWRIACLRMH